MVAPSRKKSVVHHHHDHESTPTKSHHQRVKQSERKRTASISKEDGMEYNKRVRKLHKAFLQHGTEAHQEDKQNSGSNSDVELPLFDPDCDPENPKKLVFADISSAAFNIKNGVQTTPCVVR
uniref:C2H2-type domain-containing protein n=1 Tax=Caenorhabditis tropicalis TaxID=1561998 RepID=A0A1I7SXW3_9PELO